MSVGIGVLGTGGIAARVVDSIDGADGVHVAAFVSRDPERASAAAAAHPPAVAYGARRAARRPVRRGRLHRHPEQPARAAGAGRARSRAARARREAHGARRGRGRSAWRGGGRQPAACWPSASTSASIRSTPKLRRLVASGALGEPALVQAVFGSVAGLRPGMWQLDPAVAGHGSLTGLGVHLLDLVPWLLGRPLLDVMALSDGPDAERPVESLTACLARAGDALVELTSSRRLPNAPTAWSSTAARGGPRRSARSAWFPPGRCAWPATATSRSTRRRCPTTTGCSSRPSRARPRRVGRGPGPRCGRRGERPPDGRRGRLGARRAARHALIPRRLRTPASRPLAMPSSAPYNRGTGSPGNRIHDPGGVT